MVVELWSGSVLVCHGKYNGVLARLPLPHCNKTEKMSSVNPFSYNSGDVSSYNYKRLDPSPFWNPPYSFGKKKKKKFVAKDKDENIQKIVRNVKSLPEHLIGRFKHTKENSRKSKVELHQIPLSTENISSFTFRVLFPSFRTLSILAAGVTGLQCAPSQGG